MAYRILIIEDDEVIAELVKEALEKWGYQAGRVQDFKDITEEVVQFRPDLILWILIFPFLMDFTGAGSFGRLQKCLLFSCPQQTTI